MRRLASTSPSVLAAATGVTLALACLTSGCGNDELLLKDDVVVELRSNDAEVRVHLDPFHFEILRPDGTTVLASMERGRDDAYGGPAATIDDPLYSATLLLGWDGYLAQEGAWHHGARATVVEQDESHVSVALTGPGLSADFSVSLSGARVKFQFDARQTPTPDAANAYNKTSVAFHDPSEQHFFGMGERYATVDHRGWSMYSWAEEGALGQGENAPAGADNPYPNGPSMTYFPVPFFLSSAGYGMHLNTTYRSEMHFASERPDAFRVSVNHNAFGATVYVHESPLDSIADYVEDTGRPPLPASWVFGPRRRVNVKAMVDGVPEYQRMRDRDIAVTGIDDSVHFLPALSHLGREDELKAWVKTLHASGYKAMAYNNPYVASNHANAEADFAYGKANGLFVKTPDGQPYLTEFISGKLLSVAAIDLTNPAGVSWFQDLLRRTLSFGYDGWMHDFGEYIPRNAVLFDGRRGDEVHNDYPVLSAKAAHDLMEQERPGDYLFFVRSGGSGTQGFVPAVWGGDAEATFDETLGLPSAVRGGLTLSMSGVPYWGSDMTGFKCITSAPNDKEMFLRWVALGAVSPIMMEQDACSNPLGGGKTKWKLWDDDETVEIYGRFARFHTRLMPYFMWLAARASQDGRPLTLQPWLLHPDEPKSMAVDDAFYLGPSLYTTLVVRRGETSKTTWLPPGRFVDVDDFKVYAGGQEVTIPAPLGKLIVLQVANSIVPLLDPSIDTLAPATDPSVVSVADVADVLDVWVSLAPGGSAQMTLPDGTELEATRLTSDAGNPGKLAVAAESDLASCEACFLAAKAGGVQRLRVSTKSGSASDITIEDVTLRVKGGPTRRVRWDVRRL